MNAQTLDEARLKDIMKNALLEIPEERKDIFVELFAEAIEDVGLARAIQEGEATPPVAREKVFNYLEGET